MSNTETQLTLDEAVQEVLGLLHGQDMTYDPQFDRYRVIGRMLNRALRANALEKEWSYYSDLRDLGNPVEGTQTILLDDQDRPRVINDDAVRFVNTDGNVVEWAYFLPRDALHKYRYRRGMWCSVTRNEVAFSRPFIAAEAETTVQLPVMREPVMFDLPPAPEQNIDPLPDVDPLVRDQLVDFVYPDVIVARAAYMYSLTDPLIQPRAQTLENGYKDLMYQAIERDDQNTDTPYNNEFLVPVQNGIYPEPRWAWWPLADNRR
jgi:hypothetical protein